MICSNCKPEIEQFGIAAGDPSGSVELCPVHSLVERLAEALRAALPTSEHYDSTHVLQEYDRAKESQAEGGKD